MAVVQELIRTEDNGTISFGDYAMPPTWYESGKISVFTSISLLSSTYITDLQIEELS